MLGWLPVLAFIGHMPIEVFAGVALGGCSYTAGIAFLKLDYLWGYFHAVWHVFVVLGSAVHFYVIKALLVAAA